MVRQYDLSSLNVLVVEDNKPNMTIMRSILSGIGVRTVFLCDDAVDALEIVKTNDIDFAFVDYFLDDAGGAGLVGQIRGDHSSSHNMMPIIMVSSDNSRKVVTETINCGAEGLISWPLRAVDVYQRIVSLINHPHSYVLTKGGYFGPDRRRRIDSNFKGNERRVEDCNRYVTTASASGIH